jgi:hypothetical protein
MKERKVKYWVKSFTFGHNIRRATDAEIRLSHNLANKESEVSGLARGNCLGVFNDPITGDRVYVLGEGAGVI